MKNRGRKQKLPGAIIRKLKSERGATLSMALLLFMVCAVVGGVILAAATASGGRLSQLAEMDQRYYSVTSAAKLLGEELSGKTVTIERTETTTTIYTTRNVEGKIEITQSKNGPVYSAKVDPEDAEAAWKYLKGLAEHLMFGDDSARNTGAIMGYSFSNGNVKYDDIDMTLSISDTSLKDISLKVKGKVDMESDGTLIIYLYNESSIEPESTSGPTPVSGKPALTLQADQYMVVLTMAPNAWDSESSSSYTDSNSRVDTRKITSEISWSVDSIR